MPRIFISYRRVDSENVVVYLYERLVNAFGQHNVFWDHNITGGDVFPTELEHAVDQADVVLVVIGPDWVSSFSERPDPEQTDYVVFEVSRALANQTTLVIPVLVEGAAMPMAAQLPPNIRDVTFRNAVEIGSGKDARPDSDELINVIREKTRSTITERIPIPFVPGRGGVTAGVVLVLALLLAGGFLLLSGGDDPEPTPTSAVVAADLTDAAEAAQAAEASETAAAVAAAAEDVDTSTPPPTPTDTPTATDTPEPSDTPTATHTPTATDTPSATATFTPTLTQTERTTSTLTRTVTQTPTLTPTVTASHTPTATNTPTATATPTPSATRTATNTPTATHTPEAFPDGRQIRFIYNDVSFYILNASSMRVLLTDFSFVALNDDGEVTAEYQGTSLVGGGYRYVDRNDHCAAIEVQGEAARRHLEPEDCQTNEDGEYNAYDLPAENAPRIFWTDRRGAQTFAVYWEGREIAQCVISSGSREECSVRVGPSPEGR